MDKWSYRVTMQTPLGERRGTMEVELDGRQIQGYLNLLKGPSPLEGRIDPDGSCHLRGQLITLLNTIPYTAEGRLERGWLDLLLTSDYGSFHMEGEALPASEETTR